MIPGAVIVPNSCRDYRVDENVRGTGGLKWSRYCGVSPTNDSGKLFTDNIHLRTHHLLLLTSPSDDDFCSLYSGSKEVLEVLDGMLSAATVTKGSKLCDQH